MKGDMKNENKEKCYYDSSVVYQSVAGKSYYANVYIWAAIGGQGDLRTKQTGVVVAKYRNN